MLNLAIECSGVAGSVALYAGHDLLVAHQLPPEIGSVQTLAATIQRLLSQPDTPAARRVDLISVTCGPGSFTGLRVGLATAQMLAFAWRIPVAPVDTLAAIAHGVALEHLQLGSSAPALIVPVLNAFRSQVFASAWLQSVWLQNGPPAAETVLTELAPAQVVPAADWQAAPWESLTRSGAGEAALGRLQSNVCQVLVCGSGLRTYQPLETTKQALVEQRLWEPTAEIVGQLGWHMYQRGAVVTANQLRPNYVRASAAEEQRR